MPRDASWAANTWAPSLVERSSSIYMYFANNGSGIGVAQERQPDRTVQGREGQRPGHLEHPRRLGQNIWLFDPGVFIDDDGQAYLYFGGNGEQNARVIKLNNDMVSVSGSAIRDHGPVLLRGLVDAQAERRLLSVVLDEPRERHTDRLPHEHEPHLRLHPPRHGGAPAAEEQQQQQPRGNLRVRRLLVPRLPQSLRRQRRRRAPGYRRNLGIESFTYKDDGSIVPVTYTTDGLRYAREPRPPTRASRPRPSTRRAVIETERCEEGGMDLSLINGGDWVRLRGGRLR